MMTEGRGTMGPSVRTICLGYLLPLASARSLRFVSLFVGLTFVLVLAGRMLGYVSAETLLAVRRGIVIPGVPIAAALLSEISLREGITQRTLLYALFGPASRRALAIGRTLLTALLLAAGAFLTSVLASVLLKGAAGGPGPGPGSGLGREIVAIFFGSLAYVALFGLLHVISNRGLVTALALFALFDEPLGRLPFSVRLLSPSFHLRTVGGVESTFNLPIDLHAAGSTPVLSAIALVLFAAAAAFAAAQIFSRKQLGELC